MDCYRDEHEKEYRREAVEDERELDRVCPLCGSRLKIDLAAGVVFCASMVCKYFEGPE